MTVSYGITVCNEHIELKTLIDYLQARIDKEDEIVVVYDQNRVTDEVRSVLSLHSEVHSYPFDFKQNFLENKNFLNAKCTKDYIFQIDADEIPSEFLLENLKAVLEANPVDLLITPRKNIVTGLTEEHIKRWGWRVTPQGWVNWPDSQKRVYRNDPSIQWSGHQVHGMVDGYKTYAILPTEEDWSIIHNKTINKQEQQNDRYHKIETNQI